MTNLQTPLRWGILGCARISRRGLIPGIRDSQTGFLVAIASRERSRADAWAKEFEIPRAHGSYEELLEDPDVQAVYIPLPNELHLPLVLAAADAGKHVLCEKPLALNATEARRMVEHCRGRGVALMEAFMWRHQPRTAELRRRVADGEIGELRLIRSSFSFVLEGHDWRLDPARGGGALWDVGCYGVNTARLFTRSEPIAVRSRAHFGPTGVDLSLTAELEFKNGILGLIDCSFEQPYRCCYELVGTDGIIDVPDAYLPPRQPVAFLRAGEPNSEANAGAPTENLHFLGANQYAEMVDAFAESIFEPSDLPLAAENGLAQMNALDAILRAARER